jgi:hypothetical protein
MCRATNKEIGDQPAVSDSENEIVAGDSEIHLGWRAKAALGWPPQQLVSAGERAAGVGFLRVQLHLETALLPDASLGLQCTPELFVDDDLGGFDDRGHCVSHLQV